MKEKQPVVLEAAAGRIAKACGLDAVARAVLDALQRDEALEAMREGD